MLNVTIIREIKIKATMKYHHSLVRMTIIKKIYRTSLVIQWLRICLSMRETWVQLPVWEDPASHRATKPVSHNY